MVDLLLPLLRNAGLLAVVALLYGFALARFPLSVSPSILGILCGLGAVAAMLDPFELSPGVLIDSRTTTVLLAGLFGGPVGAVLACAIGAGFRLHLGGVGAFVGVASIVLSAGIGIAAHYAFARSGGGLRVIHIVLSALLAPLASLALVLLPADIAWNVFSETFVPLNIARVAGVLVLGLMILHERRRVEAEREVRRLAFVDDLSGLTNRRAFYSRLEQDWNRWERYGATLAIVMIDIDHFKRINDTFGHPAGDEVIRRLASILQEECRKTDLPARLGGEEFAVLVTDSPGTRLVPFADRIRRRVEETVVSTGQDEIRFTISLGISRDTSRCRARQDLLSSADQALYEAKRGGRNRVVTDEPSLAETVPAASG